MTFAGFDGTGGAGTEISAQVCSKLRVPHVAVIGCVVVQNAFSVRSHLVFDSEWVNDQLAWFQAHYDIRLLNIGVLGNIEFLAAIVDRFPHCRIILDPVITSGDGKHRFLTDREVGRLKGFLTHCHLVTPNIPEAEKITGVTIKSLSDVDSAAAVCRALGANNVLIKGGHMTADKAVDSLYHEGNVSRFKTALVPFRIHGTGSFLNAAVSAFLYRGRGLKASVSQGRSLLATAVRRCDRLHPVLRP